MEAKQDLEGMQALRSLGGNMARLISAIKEGRAAGVPGARWGKEGKNRLYQVKRG